MTQPPQHPVFEQDIVPGRLGARDDPLDHPQQQLPANEVRHESDRHDKTQHHPAVPYIGRLHGKTQFPQHPVHPFVYNRLHNSLFINSFRNNAVRLHVEQEMHDIAVLYDVLLAFDGDLTRLAARFFRTETHVIVVFDHLGADKATFEIGVNDPGGLRRLRSFRIRPGAGFVRS